LTYNTTIFKTIAEPAWRYPVRLFFYVEPLAKPFDKLRVNGF
jgi:hypothetical protein